MARNIKIMGIINVTGDSYFPESRCPDAASAVERAEKLVSQGADILDIGGCSTRPGAKSVDEKTEWERLYPAITAIRKEFPSVPLSIDTFRSGIVVKTYDCIGKHIGDVTEDVAAYFRELLPKIEAAGIKECIVDPGFGFAKTIDQNYSLLHGIDRIKEATGKQVLVGISRKSMIYRLFGISPEEALPATQALHLEALIRGADILRAHDVAEAVQCRTIYGKLYGR